MEVGSDNQQQIMSILKQIEHFNSTVNNDEQIEISQIKKNLGIEEEALLQQEQDCKQLID